MFLYSVSLSQFLTVTPVCLACLQVKEGIAKIVEGVNFGTRGVRLLVSDVGSAGRLFWRAATGILHGAVSGVD